VIVGDRAITLLPYVWRDFQPGDHQTGVVSVEAYASDGPARARGKLVRAIVRVSNRGKTFDLDAEPAAIQSAS